MTQTSQVKDYVLKGARNLRSQIFLDSFVGDWPSLAILFSSMDKAFPDQEWDLAAHFCVVKIRDQIESQGVNHYSLFGGLSEICFAVKYASREGVRYGRLLEALQLMLAEGLEKEILPVLKQKVSASEFLHSQEYDIIQGYAGIGTYLLHSLEQPLLKKQLIDILNISVISLQDKNVQGYRVPGFFTPSEYEYQEEQRKKMAPGCFNLGYSHGVTGILALLSSAALKGVIVPGQMETIRRVASWIISKRQESSLGYFWAGRHLFRDEIVQKITQAEEVRDSWCYGAPGIARVLYIAAQALQDSKLESFSLETFESIFKRSHLKWGLTEPIICHGFAGLLMLTYQMAKDTQSIILSNWITRLEEEIISSKFLDKDDTSIIEGSPGILLALLSSDMDISSWNRIYLIHS